MAASLQSPRLTRFSGVLGFFIGIFGAMAILGVFFKILKLPYFEIFMVIGFIGEAAAFVIMGFLSLASGWTTSKYERLDTTSGPPRLLLQPDIEVREAVREAFEHKVSEDVTRMMATLQQEVGHFGQEIGHIGDELERARHSIFHMRQELDRVASGDLAGDAERLGRGMQVLGTEMGEAGDSVERMRADLEEMARRFRHFNEPQTQDAAQTKIRQMPWT